MVGKNTNKNPDLPTFDAEASLSSPQTINWRLTHVETWLGVLNANLLEVQTNMVGIMATILGSKL